MNEQPVENKPAVSKPDSLNREDIKKWAIQTFIFSVPAILAFLNALQGGGDFRFAFGMAQGAFLTSLINLFGKYKGS